ncbi:hypothetical protein NQ318_015107 [Aromia moschata]|uniref:Uncharacterized protein n=1 Tax=Aromia moschata TaxID=1265417 RepID=A0AAV8YYE2_9CUCU|nr:hypothetical protein NQ318_015107 [Aromia moschata]
MSKFPVVHSAPVQGTRVLLEDEIQTQRSLLQGGEDHEEEGRKEKVKIILELAKEHDKGQPPPCPEKVKESEKCPKEKPQLPYKRERDLRDPFYRKNPKPYPPVTER